MIPIRDINPTSRTAWLTLAIIAATSRSSCSGSRRSPGRPSSRSSSSATPDPVRGRPSDVARRGGAEARAAIAESFGTGEGDCGRAPGLPRAAMPRQELAGLDLRLDVPPRRLAPPGREHAVPLDLREQRRGPARADHVRRLLRAGRTGRDRAPARVRPELGACRTSARPARSRRSSAPTSCMFPRARIHTLVIFFFITFLELPASFVLVAWFVLQLFSGVGEIGRERGRRGRVLGARGRLRVRTGRDVALLPIPGAADRTSCRHHLRTRTDGYATTARR